MNEADIVISCDDIDSVQEAYIGELGFRLDSIFPADAPRVVRLSGFGIRLRIEQSADGDEGQEPDGKPQSLVVTSLGEGDLGTGRAGMQYRDLIPDRFGGNFIASHIRIQEGGPVPDYVHHHHIDFQMIFCVNGWVRVAYEDQGEPMLMEAGDCFLQPPHIRHRVLECSDAMEVVEIASPAEHETLVEHEIRLPTGMHLPERDFGGQKFVFHQAKGADWLAGETGGLEYRDTGIAEATSGVASVRVYRNTGGCERIPLQHQCELRFLFLLKGSANLNATDTRQIASGDSCAIPPDIDCHLDDVSPEFEYLEVRLPSQ